MTIKTKEEKEQRYKGVPIKCEAKGRYARKYWTATMKGEVWFSDDAPTWVSISLMTCSRRELRAAIDDMLGMLELD